MTRERLLRVARAVYLIVLGLALVYVITNRWDEIVALVDGARPGFLAASLAMSIVLPALAAVFWTVALGMLDARTPYTDVLVATARSVIARYVPGSVWYAMGRIAILRRSGVSTVSLGTVAVLEIMMSLGAVLALGASLLAIAGEMPGGVGWIAAAVVALIAMSSPPVVGAVIRRVPGHQSDALPMNWSGYGRLLGIMSFFWVWSAATFLLYLRAFPANDSFAVVVVAGGFLLSWGVGFLAFVAPQGIGAFELSLASILVAQGVAEVAVMVAGYRVVILVRDVLISAGSEGYASKRQKSETL